MKVEIIKCSKDSYWYKDEIGKTYEVENRFYTNSHKVVDSLKFIDKSDCEVVGGNYV